MVGLPFVLGGGVVDCGGLQALKILLQVVCGFVIYPILERERQTFAAPTQGFQVSAPSILLKVISFLVKKSVPKTSTAVHMMRNS